MFIIQVLWISDDGFPDLGGNNGEENCFLDEVCFMRNLLLAFNVFMQSLIILHY
jgi:hypothetical protein